MHIEFFTIDAQETLTRMQIQIRDVGHEILPEQLRSWQREDMRRHYPSIEQPDFVSAETVIYPRSRTYGMKGGTERKRPMRARPRLINVRGTSSARPILREALYDKLRERMKEMLAVNLSWVTSETAGSQPPISEHGNRLLSAGL